NELLIANPIIERRWAIRGEALFATSLLHVPTGTQWITTKAHLASPCVVSDAADEDAKVEISTSDMPLNAVQRTGTPGVTLTITIESVKTMYRFQAWAESPAIRIDVIASKGPTTQPTSQPVVKAYAPAGAGKPAPATQTDENPDDILEAFDLTPPHLRFIAV